MKKAISTHTKWTRSAFASSFAGAILAVSAPSLMAQEVQSANSQTASDGVQEEVVEVKGVRYSLEQALDVKRNAASVVDSISAADIDALPALDLGEALQALPGIQLNRDGGERDSDISLRGLPGGFTRTLAGGQSIATPSRSAGAVGEANPFGVFEASIFDGVDVIKSPTADLQAGAVAGIVNLKFPKALSKKDGNISINFGTRYEDLSDQFNNTFRFQANKHLIEDKLAFSVKLAGSEQDFRRDTANFTQYTSVNSTVADPDHIAAYRAEHGIEDDADIRFVSRAGQAAEVRSGERISGSLNVEFQATDDLKIGGNFIYTDRDLSESNLEDSQFLIRRQADNSQQQVTLLGAPTRSVLGDPTAPPTYFVSHARLTNVNWLPANRVFSFAEEAKGLYLYADYVTDDWEIDATVSRSEANSIFINQGIDLRHQVDGRRQRWAGTGINVEIDTGEGDLGQAFVRVLNDDLQEDNSALFNYSYEGNWSTPNTGGFSSTLPNSVNDGRRVQFFVNGRVDRPERDMNSFELNVQRNLDVGFGSVFRLDSVKSGLRYNHEELVNDDLRVGAGGINAEALTEENIFGDRRLFTETQNEFFNGNYPGAFTSQTGWRTIDSENLVPLLQEGLADRIGENDSIAEPTGFAVRLAGGRNQFFARNFSTDQTIKAGYLMADFSGELGPIYYSGNFGVRRIDTDNEFVGPLINAEGELTTRESSNGYTHTLPSANIKFELTDDIVLRLASYKGIVRPNLRSQNPTTQYTVNRTSVRVQLPAADVEPYTADNFDISLEWYNRAGSAVSIGYFQKEVEDLFGRLSVCGSNIPTEISDGVFGPTELAAGEDGELGCDEIEPFRDADGNLLIDEDTGEPFDDVRSINVSQAINADGSIKLSGFEFAAQQKLDFLPYPWNGFGGVFNYTKINTDESDDGLTLLRVSPESYNIVGYWENNGVSIRLSYNWRDDQQLSQNIILDGTNSGFLGTDARFETDRGRLDLSASYRFNRNFRINARAFNITEDQGYEYIGGTEDAVNRIRFTGRTYQLNATYTF